VSSTTCDPGALSYDTLYYWKVEANGLNGPSPGPVWDFTTGSPITTSTICLPLILKPWPPIPDVPVLNPITLEEYGHYIVSWTSAPRATSYTLEEATSDDFADAQALYQGQATALIISGKPPGTYFYRVEATNSWGSSGWSNAEAIFCDDFRDPGSGWGVYETEAVRWRYIDGRYEGTMKWPGYIAYERAPLRADDYTLQAEVYPVTAAEEGTHGLVFGLSEDWTQFYSFMVQPSHGAYDGLYCINKYTSAGWTTLRGWTEYSVSPTHVTLGVIRKGANIEVYIDGAYVDTVHDGELTGLRRVGVAVSASGDASGPVTAQFDDFMLATSAD
jgi:hypothetical protein